MEIYSRFVISSFSESVLMLNLRSTIYSYTQLVNIIHSSITVVGSQKDFSYQLQSNMFRFSFQSLNCLISFFIYFFKLYNFCCIFLMTWEMPLGSACQFSKVTNSVVQFSLQLSVYMAFVYLYYLSLSPRVFSPHQYFQCYLKGHMVKWRENRLSKVMTLALLTIHSLEVSFYWEFWTLGS